MSEDVYILGIESSCDETAAAVVKNYFLTDCYPSKIWRCCTGDSFA